MPYKVFLVEDEIVTREGIRDNVNWRSAGFEFCGEAPDGEMALPLIEKNQPDVVLTDIKMPFMDGLQLCKIIRKQMPWIKIVVLSGHDEFEFAQAAVKLGVSEYLLKPISAAELEAVLRELAIVLGQEREESARLKELQRQMQEVLAMKKDRLLLELVVGGVTSAEAIEEYGHIGLDMIAEYYLVILLKLQLFQNNGHLDPAVHQKIRTIVTNLTDTYPGAFGTQKSVEELLLILMGDDPRQLEQDGQFLAELIKTDIEAALGCQVKYGIGSIQQRLTAVQSSFIDALSVLNQTEQRLGPSAGPGAANLAQASKLDQSAVDNYLRTGLISEFDAFFEDHLQPISEAALQSTLIKHYLFVEVLLSSAQFVAGLGGEETEIIPAMTDVESLLADVKTIDRIRESLRSIMVGVLTFRNDHAQNDKAELIYHARTYIDAHFADPNLLLEEVASSVNLSPSHFSMVFGRETGESFKAYLTRIRIEHAKELLRTTTLKCSDIAYRSGYNDAHYFSYAFKKSTGVPPQQYRQSLGT